MSSFKWNIQGNHFIFESNNFESYASKFVKCLDDNFLNNINEILEEKVLNKLVNEEVINKEEIKNLLLTKSDFPSWYFK